MDQQLCCGHEYRAHSHPSARLTERVNEQQNKSPTPTLFCMISKIVVHI